MKYEEVEQAKKELFRHFPGFKPWFLDSLKGSEQEILNFYGLLTPFFKFIQTYFNEWTDQQRKKCFDYIEDVLSNNEASYAESMELFVVHNLDLIDDSSILQKYMGKNTANIFDIWKD